MTSFIVLSHDGTSDEKPGDKTIFVRDAFSIWALAAPVIWLLWYRLWFHVAMVGLATILIFLLIQSPTFIFVVAPLNLMLGCFVALESSAWRISALRRDGYTERDVVDAESLEEAQIIWAVEAPQEYDAKTSNKQDAPAFIAKREGDLIFGGAN